MCPTSRLVLLLASTLLAVSPRTQDPREATATIAFPAAQPEAYGLSSERLSELVAKMKAWVENDEVVGAELLIIKNRRTILHKAVGFRDQEDESPWQLNTICRIRSMTKPFVGTSIQMLIEAGKLKSDDKVAKFLPSFDNPKSKGITVENLLRHEAGFLQPGYPSSLDGYKNLRAAVDAVGEAGPETAPGERYFYSDAGSATLGALVEEISGMPSEAFIRARVIEPLGLQNTACVLTLADPRRARVSSTYIRVGRSFRKYWDDAMPQEMKFFRASGGMYSTTTDYARFLAVWMDLGAFGDHRLLRPDTVRGGLSEGPLSISLRPSYGRHWQIFGSSETVYGLPQFGHSGSDGTMAIAYPDKDLIICYFTQSRGGGTVGKMSRELRQALPQTRAIGGRSLYVPPLPAAVRQEREAKLATARTAALRNQGDVETLIWWGRRRAYVGDYVGAVRTFDRIVALLPADARVFRHLGHRQITLRKFDNAIVSLTRATELIAGHEDEVEPDGLPNARNIPTSTLQSNIWYHLGLAHYLKGDFEAAVHDYAECLKLSRNPDALCSTTHWYYMTLRRLGRTAEAAELLKPIHADMDVIENHAYHLLCLLYKGERTAKDVLGSVSDGDGIQNATAAYGVANWHLYNNRSEQGRALCKKILEGEQWPAFGYIAAEVEVHGR